jgi:hypothetical protein
MGLVEADQIPVRLVVGYRPYNVETYVRIVDRERSNGAGRCCKQRPAPRPTTQGLPPEAMIVDTNIAI